MNPLQPTVNPKHSVKENVFKKPYADIQIIKVDFLDFFYVVASPSKSTFSITELELFTIYYLGTYNMRILFD